MKIRCGSCGHSFDVPDGYPVGEKIKCPGCQKLLNTESMKVIKPLKSSNFTTILFRTFVLLIFLISIINIIWLSKIQRNLNKSAVEPNTTFIDDLKVRSLTVVDEDGYARIRLHLTHHNSAEIYLSGKEPDGPYAYLEVSPRNEAKLVIGDENNSKVYIRGGNYKGSSAFPEIQICRRIDSNTAEIAIGGCLSWNTPGISLTGPNGKTLMLNGWYVPMYPESGALLTLASYLRPWQKFIDSGSRAPALSVIVNNWLGAEWLDKVDIKIKKICERTKISRTEAIELLGAYIGVRPEATFEEALQAVEMVALLPPGS